MKKAAVPSILVAVVLLALGVIAEAQQPKKVPRIGYIASVDAARESARSEAIRLELLKDVLPGISRVGALLNATQSENDFKWYEAPARALKINLQLIKVRDPNPDFDAAFQAAAKGRAGALITIAGGLLNPNAKRIADLAIKNRLPSMHEKSDYVDAGGLMSYSANEAASNRRAAAYVDRILKGSKPADLPVEQPTDFDLVINLKTATQIGLTIPQSVLYRADKVIK